MTPCKNYYFIQHLPEKSWFVAEEFVKHTLNCTDDYIILMTEDKQSYSVLEGLSEEWGRYFNVDQEELLRKGIDFMLDNYSTVKDQSKTQYQAELDATRLCAKYMLCKAYVEYHLGLKNEA